MISIETIFQSLDIIVTSRIWKDKPPSHTLKILLYMNAKGWLYAPEENDKVQAVIGAYRIPDVTDEAIGRLPEKESGIILYIPFVINVSKADNTYKVVRNAMRKYLKENADINEIVLEGKDDKLRRYKIGDQYGQSQELRIPRTTEV